MKNHLLKYKDIFSAKKFQIVGVEIGAESEFSLFTAIKKGFNLSFGEHKQKLTLNQLCGELNKNTHLLLHIYGKGVITKSLPIGNDGKKELLFNANPKEFYFHQFNASDQKIVSIVRKEVVDDIIMRFSGKKYLVVDVSIGFGVGLLFKNIYDDNTYNAYKYQLIFKGEQFVEYKENHGGKFQLYTIGEDEVNNFQIPGVSLLLNHLYPDERISYSKLSHITTLPELRQRKIFKVASIFILVFFLSSLLLSYATLEHYKSKYIGYQEQMYFLNETYETVKKLEKEKLEKESIIKESGVLANRYITADIFHILQSVPDGIIVNSMEYNPIKKKIKDGEPLIMDMNKLNVSGSTKSSLRLTDWINAIKANEWVENVKIEKFNKDRAQILNFNLSIKYK